MKRNSPLAGKRPTMASLIQLHEPMALSVAAWFWKGAALRHASDIVWHQFWRTWSMAIDSHIEDEDLSPEQKLDIKLGAVWRMLTGMAIEAFTKGIIIARDPKKLSEAINLKHHLKELCAKAQIKLQGKEKSYLEVLEKAVLWEGRYPVPKKAPEMDVFFPPDKDDLLVVNTLFERIAKEYKAILHSPTREVK